MTATGKTPLLAGLALLAAFATPASAQTTIPATPDPNGIDTGNFSAPSTDAQQTLAHDLAQLGWIFGPQTIPIGTTATIAIPTGYEMLTPPDAEKFLQLNGNPVASINPDDYILQNEDPDSGWFAVITPESGGHIPDSGALSPDSLLATMQNVTAQYKPTPPALTGWAVPPTYDQTTHKLQWAYTFTLPNGTKSIPLSIRILGRTTDEKITVVDDPAAVVNDVPDVNKAIAGLTFNQSQQYSDYAQGDATAPYGLAGLIEGASAATNTLPPPEPPSHTGRYIAIAAIIAVAIGLLGWLGLKARK